MKLSTASLSRKVLAFAVAAALPLAAHADRLWLLPSATELSGNDSWVTVDAAVSDNLFFADHAPLRLDGLTITAPDGSAVKEQNAVTGRYRSVFDAQLPKDGTYRISVQNRGVFASYKVGDERKRWRGSVDAFAKEVPADAQDLQVTENDMRVETFVTRGKADTGALKPTGHGLELVALSHPNDLVAGTPAGFRLMLDGKPAANVKVSVVPGGTRYRDNLDEVTLVTDAGGKFDVRFPAPGAYWVGAQVRDDRTSVKQAKERRVSYAATFEVLPQ
ncbi:DUF4198 domain-containing protein [Paraburkholderia antibiotica]|uniref:DUF4198 domain-containing protein n=1 Tax=Paraburkholderia antibiotica TaxID=2728839 RepID=A0A7X9X6A8_9BURK|nr:DUF4198 domain-containing protein [Paraburkholderia antibiotica]NML32190.1 DUF4198 domain-containing protein [Paraburkholderia antibiotica]